jgi:hypothetical protein
VTDFSKKLLSYAGTALQFIGWHSLPDISVLRNAIQILGQTLKLEKASLDSGPYHAFLAVSGNFPVRDGCHLIFINGILNNLNDVWSTKKMIETFCCTKIAMIWVPTRGAFADTADAMMAFLGACTGNVKGVRSELEKYIREQVKEGESVHLLLHSKGAILGNAALKWMDASLREKISKVSAFGPGKFISKYPGIDVQNFVSSHDPVPLLDPAGWIRSFITDEICINYVESSNFLPIEHSMRDYFGHPAARRRCRGF